MVTSASFLASLIGVEGGNSTRIGRFANYLRNLLPSSDPVVMEMASKAIGRLAMAGDTFTAEYVEFEVKRALEWLGADRNEGRRHAAVSSHRAEPSQGEEQRPRPPNSTPNPTPAVCGACPGKRAPDWRWRKALAGGPRIELSQLLPRLRKEHPPWLTALSVTTL